MNRGSNLLRAGLFGVGLIVAPWAALADPSEPVAPKPAAAPASTPAPAQTPAPTPEVQGAYGDWSLYEFEEGGYPVCYLASRVMKSSESVPGRSPSFVLITNRPAEGKRYVVSVVAGYPYQDGSAVTVAVGRHQFHLFTDIDTAWAEDAVDPLIVQAIHSGSSLNVSGKMKDGPVVADNFSLKGATEALGALDKACPMPGQPVKGPHRKRKKAQ